MKAVTFPEVNKKVAEFQPQFETLPVYHNEKEGSITFCFELDKEEMKRVFESGRIYLKQYTDNGPMQPIGMSCLKEMNISAS